VRVEDADEALVGRSGGLREQGAGRYHRVEQRQRQGDPRALEERAAADVLLRDVHD
jgi:hypothetical protein